MTYHIGDVLEGKVTGLQPYGAFVSLDAHTQGLVHISECQHGFVKQVSDTLAVGDHVQVMVLDIDEYSKKISLSIRALTEDPQQSEKKQHKHYFSKRHINKGFSTIENAMPDMLNEALHTLATAKMN